MFGVGLVNDIKSGAFSEEEFPFFFCVVGGGAIIDNPELEGLIPGLGLDLTCKRSLLVSVSFIEDVRVTEN